MMAVGNLAVGSHTCAGCHIGAAPKGNSPLRDVNHDLIAAGHPRLDFEFAAFAENMPPHWNEKAKKRQHPPGYEGKIWAVGQVASAAAALELLAYRAHPDNARPWPEFAEYDCYACHHNLAQPTWRQSESHYGKRMPGSLPWGTWYYPTLPALAKQNRIGNKEFQGPFAQLMGLMKKPYPAPKRVAEQARTTANRLQKWSTKIGAKEITFDPTLARNMLSAIRNDSEIGNKNWDGAEQFFLAAVALRYAQGDKKFAENHKALVSQRAFSGGFDSPHKFEPEQFSSELRRALEQLGN